MDPRKIVSCLLALLMVFSLAACSQTAEEPQINVQTEEPAVAEAPAEVPAEEAAPQGPARPESYVRFDDEARYDELLGAFYGYRTRARDTRDVDEALLLYAKAEAELLGSFTMNPLYAYEAGYMVSALAPNTGMYYMGAGSAGAEFAVAATELITAEDRQVLLDLWESTLTTDEEYDAKGWLQEHGYTITDRLTDTFGAIPTTLDRSLTFECRDFNYLAPTNLTLTTYDYKGRLTPVCAESWDVSEDGLTYTFHIRPGIYWYTSEGTQYAELTANDWVAGFRHMCDAQYGYDAYLLSIRGIDAYAHAGGAWEDVGIRALDDYTLEIVFDAQDPAFFGYACTYFYPLCDSWFLSHGGAYGVQEFAEACTSVEYTYANSSNVASQVYCGV